MLDLVQKKSKAQKGWDVIQVAECQLKPQYYKIKNKQKTCQAA
jgi:G:T-mismatch repair DNA endonuclease (very short patch repair protein)